MKTRGTFLAILILGLACLLTRGGRFSRPSRFTQSAQPTDAIRETTDIKTVANDLAQLQKTMNSDPQLVLTPQDLSLLQQEGLLSSRNQLESWVK